MQKVLYISYDGMTDPLGQSQVIPYLKGLSAAGYRIHLMSFEKKESLDLKKSEIQELLQKSNIHWHSITYTKKPPILSTLFDLYRMRRKARELHKKENFEIIHCRSYIASICGVWMKKKYGTKFLFDMRGFWADERVDGGIWNIRNPLYRLVYKYFKFKETEFLNLADYTVSLTEAGKKEIHSWKNIPGNPIPIEVIPCCVDTLLFSRKSINPEISSDLRNNIGVSQEDYLLSYLGSLGTWYLLDEMLNFFLELLNTKPTAKFLFITPDDPSWILNAAVKINIPPDKIIIRKAARSEVASLLSLSDASVFFIKPCYSKLASSPTKLGEIMALGIPCICNIIGDISPTLHESVITVRGFNKDEFREAIAKLNALRAEACKNEIETSGTLFSLENGTQSYAKVYKKICE